MLRSRILAPSDVVSVAGRGRLRVGGRIVKATRHTLWIADAFTTVEAELSSPHGATPGDLAIVEGLVEGARLVSSRLLGHRPCPALKKQAELLRLGPRGVAKALAARARALAAIRAHFDVRGFLEVQTPVRVTSPGLDAHVDAVRAEGGFLVTSPEHHMKRLLVGGLPRIYQLACCSRAGEEGPWHEPEFTLLEWYRAFAGQNDVMRDAEELVIEVAERLTDRAELRVGGRRVRLERPFERLTVRDAFRRAAGVSDAADLAATDEHRYFQVLVDHVEPALARRREPVFLTEFPLSQASYARPTPSDTSVAERFELYAGGVELCNGFGELTDAAEQRRRFERERARRRRAGSPLHPIDESFLGALEQGLPPAAGNALGVDRLVALALGAATIADVQSFPSSWR